MRLVNPGDYFRVVWSNTARGPDLHISYMSSGLSIAVILTSYPGDVPHASRHELNRPAEAAAVRSFAGDMTYYPRLHLEYFMESMGYNWVNARADIIGFSVYHIHQDGEMSCK